MARGSQKQSVLRSGKTKASLESYAGPILPGPDTRDQKAEVPSLGTSKINQSASQGNSRGNNDEGDGRH